jgi:hypothetical protein
MGYLNLTCLLDYLHYGISYSALDFKGPCATPVHAGPLSEKWPLKKFPKFAIKPVLLVN